MTRFNRVRAKAGSRANPRSRGKPSAEPEPRQKVKYVARAKKRAKLLEAEHAARTPALIERMAAEDAMDRFGFQHRFSIVVNAKANAHDEIFIKKTGASIRDLRYLAWSSIDSYYGRDLDQVEYCERGQGGSIQVKVAIADVDAFVPKGSVLDAHAQANATSVYPGRESYPMLPEQLSSGFSSFRADCDRLALVVEFAVLPRGNVRFGKIYRALVRSKAQLSCGEVGAWLESQGSHQGSSWEIGEEQERLEEMFELMPELAEQIRLQDEASRKISLFNEGKGAAKDGAAESGKAQEAAEDGAALQAAGNEISSLMSAEGKDRAKTIVRNFMACASGAMIAHLEGARFSPIRRVVSAPKEWEGIVGIASAAGFEMPAEPDAISLAEFLASEKEKSPDKYPALCAEISKLLGEGEYALFDRREPVEYLCFANADYLVGTSPNHRYMDLVVQRLLKAAVAHTPVPYSKAELSELAAICTERENAAKKVERAVKFASAPAKR